jgi:DNA-binding NtrC family response regulator
VSARIVLVHDDRRYLEAAASALKVGGYDIAAFTNPMAALKALDGDRAVDLLVTRVAFERGTIHGIALARMAKVKCLDIRILFIDLPEKQEHTDGIGAFVALPVEVPDLIRAIERLPADPGDGSI